MKKILESMDATSRKFYSRVLNNALLNLYAVRRGYFDTLLCEATDKEIIAKWNQALPKIISKFLKDK